MSRWIKNCAVMIFVDEQHGVAVGERRLQGMADPRVAIEQGFVHVGLKDKHSQEPCESHKGIYTGPKDYARAALASARDANGGDGTGQDGEWERENGALGAPGRDGEADSSAA